MIVGTHFFKEAFVEGRAVGFVIADESVSQSNFATRAGFAEIFGCSESYRIFEDRSAAESHLAEFLARDPGAGRLAIREVNVESIRDYQHLAGRKTVLLVDREGRITQSLRVGDMPLAARTQTPFPVPLPSRARLVKSSATHAPDSIPCEIIKDGGATRFYPESNIAPRRRPTLRERAPTDPFANEPFDNGEDGRVRTSPRNSAAQRGPLARFLRRLIGKHPDGP
jgi:hypothetical protein